MEVFLQITAFIVLVYALKIKMYKTNLVGLSTIFVISFLSLLVENCNIILVSFLSIYLILICFYDFYKRNKRCLTF